MIHERDLMPYGKTMKPSAFETPAPARTVPQGVQQSCVYFVEAVGTNLVKIGTIVRLDTIQKRIELLQTGCPYELRLTYIVDGGGRREEHRFHKALDPLCFRNEWFRRVGVLAELLEAAKADPDRAAEIALRLISY